MLLGTVPDGVRGAGDAATGRDGWGQRSRRASGSWPRELALPRVLAGRRELDSWLKDVLSEAPPPRPELMRLPGHPLEYADRRDGGGGAVPDGVDQSRLGEFRRVSRRRLRARWPVPRHLRLKGRVRGVHLRAAAAGLLDRRRRGRDLRAVPCAAGDGRLRARLARAGVRADDARCRRGRVHRRGVAADAGRDRDPRAASQEPVVGLDGRLVRPPGRPHASGRAPCPCCWPASGCAPGRL